MPTILIVAVVFLLLVAIAFVTVKLNLGITPSDPKLDVYYLKKSLFSPAERSFYGVLQTLNYEGITITSKVRLADIFGIKKGLGRGNRQGALNRIIAKHVDFLFIQQSDGRPVLGIELDDRSHEMEERIA